MCHGASNTLTFSALFIDSTTPGLPPALVTQRLGYPKGPLQRAPTGSVWPRADPRVAPLPPTTFVLRDGEQLLKPAGTGGSWCHPIALATPLPLAAALEGSAGDGDGRRWAQLCPSPQGEPGRPKETHPSPLSPRRVLLPPAAGSPANSRHFGLTHPATDNARVRQLLCKTYSNGLYSGKAATK